jgi:hypothetical protein
LAFPGHFSPYSDITSRRIRASYVLVKPPSPHRGTWRDTFALSKRHLTSGFYFFQSKWTVPRLAAPNLGQIDAIQVSQLANQRLTPYVQEASEETSDGAIAGSIFKSKLLAMPSSLARYAILFYLSSLVRYDPASVDYRVSPDQAWLADAICDQSRIWILRDALSGITGNSQVFNSQSSYRT